jgi:hypothetical protein
MENEELFNVDFNLISDEEIDTSEMVVDTPAEGEEVELKEEEELTPPVDEEKKEEKVEEGEEEKIEISAAGNLEEDEADDKIDTKEKSPGSDTRDSSPVTPFASLLHEKGILSNYDAEEFAKAVEESDDPFDVITNAMQKELEVANAKFINSFPPDLIDMAMAVAQGVPYEAMKGPKLAEINYSKITEDKISESEDLQKKIVTDLLEFKGIKPARINKLVETLGDSGALEEEAMDAINELKEIAKAKQEQIKKDFANQQKHMNDQYAAQIESIGVDIDKTEEIIPGIKLTKSTKDKLFNNLTRITGNDQNGNSQNYIMTVRQKDPIHFDKNVAYLAELTKGFTDWSKLTKSAKSTATAELENVLNKKSTGHTTGSHKKVGNRTDTADGSLMASLENMKWD